MTTEIESEGPPKPVALITGGTGALGSILAETFRAAGYRLALPVRSSRNIPQALDDGLIFALADLSQELEVESFVKQTLARWGRIDVLIHAAGGFVGGEPVEKTSLADWDRMMEINLQTAFLIVRAVLPTMRTQASGRIVCMTALSGMKPAPRFAAYGVSKRALIGLVEAVAEEVKDIGITCNALAPGTILTQANLDSMPGANTSTWVRPEQIAALCLFLTSDAAAAINGSVIRLPGGA